MKHPDDGKMTKGRADAWLELYTSLRQAGWKHYKDGTWSHPDHGTMHYLTNEAERILGYDKEKHGRLSGNSD